MRLPLCSNCTVRYGILGGIVERIGEGALLDIGEGVLNLGVQGEIVIVFVDREEEEKKRKKRGATEYTDLFKFVPFISLLCILICLNCPYH